MPGQSALQKRTLGYRPDDARYPGKLRALIKPTLAFPVPSAETVTFGTVVSAGSSTPAQTNGSIQTNPIMYPLFKGGSFGNGVDKARFAVYGWPLANRYNNGWVGNGAYTGGDYPSAIEFVHYGSRFEVRFNGEASSALFQVFVDGAPTSATPYSITPASVGGSNLVPVTFSGGTKLRRIRLEFTRSVSLGGIIVASLDFIAAAGKHLQAQGLLIGDSYSDGANGVPSLNTYAYRLGKYLGCDLLIEGQGGTGFVAVSGSGKSRYIDRIISAYANTPGLNPDFVFLQGSVNDANGNEVNLPTYLLPAIAQVRAYWPRAKIIMNNLLFPSGVPGNGMTTASTNLKAAASKVDLFIDPVTEVWYGGNSNAASPNGSGNSDVLLSSDGLHPTQVGHDMMASVLARRIVDYFNTL